MEIFKVGLVWSADYSRKFGPQKPRRSGFAVYTYGLSFTLKIDFLFNNSLVQVTTGADYCSTKKNRFFRVIRDFSFILLYDSVIYGPGVQEMIENVHNQLIGFMSFLVI